jgi:organic radical activating enzyme
MFGQNPIRANEQALDGKTLAVQEIFYTIQGEGPFAGCPSVFIRLAGCNLACAFCDTDFESKIDNRLTVEQIVGQVLQFPHPELVVLTGGEPLRQNVEPLLMSLLNSKVNGKAVHVQIETAGTLHQNCVDWPRVHIVCSPKTPKIHPAIERTCLHYKYIVEAGRVAHDDGLPAYGTQLATMRLPQKLYRPHALNTATIWVSPCDPGTAPGGEPSAWALDHRRDEWKANTSAAVQSAMKHGYRLSLQMHKILGLP